MTPLPGPSTRSEAGLFVRRFGPRRAEIRSPSVVRWIGASRPGLAALVAACGLLVASAVQPLCADGETERAKAPAREESRDTRRDPPPPEGDGAVEKEKDKKADQSPRVAPADRDGGTKKEENPGLKQRIPRVALPSQGVYTAAEIARLAGKASGRPVRVGDTGVEQRQIEIIPLLAGQLIKLDELKLLLAFHGIYLFESVDPDDGDILVATTDPRWSPRQARYSHVIEVPPLSFKPVWKRLKTAIDEHNAANAARGHREADVVGVPVEAVGKIFLRAPNRKTLSRLIQLTEAPETRRPNPDRMKMFAYRGRYRHVRDLEKDVVEQLSEGERVRARFVVMKTGNRLLYRAPARVGERITELLQKLDRRPR